MASRKDFVQILTSVFDPATNSLRISGDGGGTGGTGGTGSSTFLGLTDTPSSFSGAANRTLKVNASGSAIEFVNVTPGATRLTELQDGPGVLVSNKFLAVNSSGTGVVLVDPPTGNAFVGLTDTPSTFAGQSNRVVRVNSTATALEFGGYGLPPGGTAGQILAKSSGIDYVTEWMTLPTSTGSGSGSNLTLVTEDILAKKVSVASKLVVDPTGQIVVPNAYASIANLVVASEGPSVTVLHNAYDNADGGGGITVLRSAGTTAAPTGVGGGTDLGQINWQAYHTGNKYRRSAAIIPRTTEAHTTSGGGTNLEFIATATGAGVPLVRLTVAGDSVNSQVRIKQSNASSNSSIQDLFFTGTSTGTTSVTLTNTTGNYGTITIPTGGAATFSLQVIGRRTDVPGECNGFIKSGLVTNYTGTPEVIGQGEQRYSTPQDASWTANLMVSNGNIVISCSGAAGKTISWTASVRLAISA